MLNKKNISIGILIIALSGVALTSCRSAPPPAAAEAPAQDKKLAPERRDLPEFFLSPPVPEDQYVGLGMAKLKDDNLSRTTALARARADIATQISVVVESMLTDYAQESGADDNTQTLTFVERVSKEVANIELSGAITKEQYPANDGTWYVMVYFPKGALLDEVEEVFNRNEDAAFAEFKAQQALDRLNSELEGNPPKSAGLDSPVNKE
ncbi:MAG: hypothetical protein B6D68_00200 [spirochete symbiont of Stewartia floridana]|nr:MAG: hypothetical protein B6D68_00200 [spirochete symbiont of Stewartia floridana]